jgi:hypothetical protein
MGRKNKKYLLELRKTQSPKGVLLQQQHNNQMVELGACGGGRMDRDHVHDP